MKKKFFTILTIIFASVLLLLIANPTQSLWSSPNRSFNVIPEIIYLNWTTTPKYQFNIILSQNLSLTVNNTLKIWNSTAIVPNYTQPYVDGEACYRIVGDSTRGIGLLIKNVTDYSNYVYSFNTTNSTEMVMIYKDLEQCRPGRHWTNSFTISNISNQAENLNISVFIDIPISSNNSINTNLPLTGIASFSGSLPANATAYHHYFFNATSSNISDVRNATGIVVNISGWSSSQDIDLFLFDASGNLIAKSINKTGTNESLIYSYLPSSASMWELRLYGNFSTSITYTGNLIFTTLNSTNTTNTTQQISSINYGLMNATNTTQINITLKNEGNLTLSNVVETKEIYFVKRFAGNDTRNFTFLVPDSSIASKIKISLNWTGDSNYSFNLYKPSNNTVEKSSMNKYIYANISGANQEEYNETSDIVKGHWKVEVKNNTVPTNWYNVTVYIYVNASEWIITDYTTMTFSRTGNNNYTADVQLNLTVPNSTMEGGYEGFLQYAADTGSVIRIPFEMTTKTATLVINNTVSSQTIQIDENIGINVSRSYNISINNTGSYSLSFTAENSSSSLTHSSGSYINFTVYNLTSPISANYGGLFNITFNISTNTTADTEGIYEGWIKFVTDDSHPYQNFTLTLRVNLTSKLNVYVDQPITIDDDNVVNTTTGDNVTAKLYVTYINGTNITTLNTSNFNSAWLTEGNISYRVPTTGSLSISNGTPLLWDYYSDKRYRINLSIPANQPGGLYEVHVNLSYIRGSYTFTGEGIGWPLIMNNTGLYMSNASSSVSVSNASSTTYYVNVTNYGPVAASSAYITFRNPCGGYTIATSSTPSAGCPGATQFNASTYSVSVAAHNSSCLLWWTITGGSIAASACTSNIIGSNPTNVWFNNKSVSVTVTAPSAGEPTPSPGPSPEPTPTPTYVANLEFVQAESLIIVQQNSSNSTIVIVNNTGNVSQSITFTIEDINSTWYTLNATTANLSVGKSAGFLVTFSVGKVDIKDYTGKYKAYSPNKTITSAFTLRIPPTEEEEETINVTLENYKLNMTTLSEEINQSKEQGVNTSVAESKLLELRLMVEQAESYIDEGDYFNAYQLLDDIEVLIDAAWEELIKAREEHGPTGFVLPPLPWLWISIALGGVGAAILAYLLWPTKRAKLPYMPKEKEKMFPSQKKEQDVWEQLKEKWSKIKKK